MSQAAHLLRIQEEHVGGFIGTRASNHKQVLAVLWGLSTLYALYRLSGHPAIRAVPLAFRMEKASGSSHTQFRPYASLGWLSLFTSLLTNTYTP
eukprot:1009520-Amphidinium_carterae.1